MTFIGRKEELRVLESAYQAEGNQFFPIYGRRRVGKSELIKKFIEKKPAVYYLGKQAPGHIQIHEFLENAAATLGQPLLASLSVSNWKEAFTAVLSQWKESSKLIIALDEFQWMVDSEPGLPSYLQELIDNNWGGGSNVFLVLCGSFMGFMEKKVLGEKSPLFGRRTGQIQLRPFSYLEARGFHPSWSIKDQAKTYFICGGIPYYLKFFNDALSVDQNIQQNFLSEYSALAKEPDFLLREELKELQNYYGILMALSTTRSTNSEISKLTGIDERKLFYYTQNLIELGYVAKHHPLTSGKPNQRHVHFKLQDPLLRFWFRFIFPNLSIVSQMDPKLVFTTNIKPRLESYFGLCFEILCREALPYIYQKENILTPFTIGEYWAKNVQIDLVGYRQDGRIDLGECKWGKIESVETILVELMKKVRLYPNHENATIQPRIFTLDPVSAPKNENCIFHSLEELYSTPMS